MIVSATSDNNDETKLRLMQAFQKAMIQQNATALGELFTPMGSIEIPMGSDLHIKGRNAIIESFSSYFDTLISIDEYSTSPHIVYGDYGAFSKQISSVKTNGCPVNYPVVNRFYFQSMNDGSSSSLGIDAFQAIFNLTDVIRQSNCH